MTVFNIVHSVYLFLCYMGRHSENKLFVIVIIVIVIVITDVVVG